MRYLIIFIQICCLSVFSQKKQINDALEDDIPNTNIPKKERLKLIDQFINNDVIAMLTGHLHRLNVQNYSNMEHISSEPLAVENNDSLSGFRVCKLIDGKLTSDFHSVKYNHN